MEDQSQNLFTYYRGPSARDSTSAVGRQLEDNATASLLRILQEANKRDSEVSQAILEELVNQQRGGSRTEISVDDQVTLGQLDLENKEVFLTGLTSSDVGIEDEIAPQEDSDGGRADGIIRLGTDAVVILEIKTQDSTLGTRQRERYAGELGIEDIENRYNTTTWVQLYSRLNAVKSDVDDEVLRFLLDEFTEFLELTTLEQVIAVAPWEEDDEKKFNKITLRYHRSMNRRTALEPEQPQYHIEFKSTGYNAVAFGPSEWKEAIDQMPDEVINGFLEQDFSPVEDYAGETLANVGKTDGVQKLIESKPNSGNHRIVFQSKTDKSNSHYRRRPTIHEVDFINYFETDSGPALPSQGDLLKTLFVEGDLEEVHKQIGKVPADH